MRLRLWGRFWAYWGKLYMNQQQPKKRLTLEQARAEFDDSDKALLGKDYEYYSHHYQHLFKERTLQPTSWDSVIGKLEVVSDRKPDAYWDLKDRLLKEVLRIIRDNCTLRQRMIVTLYFLDGYTQWEVARIMGFANQSSIIKTLYGNPKQSMGRVKRLNLLRQGKDRITGTYGGALPKIRRACANDPVIQDIWRQIKELG